MATPLIKNKNDVLLALVIDKSGSMMPKREEVIQGVNSFIAEQKKLPGKAAITLTFFDSYVTTPIVDTPIESFNTLDETNYKPSGWTALNDAVAQTIHSVRLRANGRKVIFVVVTDGEENSSRHYVTQTVKQLIETGQAEGWDFTFIGAGPNAWSQANTLGFKSHDFAHYDSNRLGGTVAAFAAANTATVANRTLGSKLGSQWQDEVKK
jgi:hypothetical protein